MPAEPSLVRIATLKAAEQFRAHVAALGVEIPCDDAVLVRDCSPLAQPVAGVCVNGRRVGNRVAVHPMEGWDGTTTGGVTDDVRRRWQRFGESGAKLICGGEAMAIRPEARANPHQLILNDANWKEIAGLVALARQAHWDAHGGDEDLVIGFQLTHSGRFCRPFDKARMEPRVAFRHPILDRRFGVTSDAQVMTDAEVEGMIGDYVHAARLARLAGADFVDLKHCHGYLLHEFLGAHTRSGRYGGSFENRTRILRELVAAIRADKDPIDIGVRVSAFDLVPFRADPETSRPGKPGRGVPEDYSGCLPYRYGFGVNEDHPLEVDLTEPKRFVALCWELGVKILNLSGGSPYYNPHIQRPAAYPPSDGYLPPEDPLVGVARQLDVTRRLSAHLAALPGEASDRPKPVLVGSAYSYLQEYLPHVAQAVVRSGWTDLVGMGRMVLSYPGIFADGFARGGIQSRLICRTFSDCTTAPRNGMVSGCYPLDRYYAERPEAARVKAMRRSGPAGA
jgi:2,4-dienoyl-CoA reductase-like NADH-dependent reductase (Old Yellow Enzyme family)